MNNIFSPALPTMPIQDKFGQVVISFGMNKLEYATMQIAAAIAGRHGDKVFPETVAQTSIEIAMAVFDACEDEFKKASLATDGTKLVLNGGK